MEPPIEETLLDLALALGRKSPPEVLPHHRQAEVVKRERLPHAIDDTAIDGRSHSVILVRFIRVSRAQEWNARVASPPRP